MSRIPVGHRLLSKPLLLVGAVTVAWGVTAAVNAQSTSNVRWLQQFGTSGFNSAGELSIDHHGQIYVSGHSNRSFVGQSDSRQILYVSKYDPLGNRLGIIEMGFDSYAYELGVSADSLENVFLYGFSTAGLGQIFVRKYDAAGQSHWIATVGTPLPLYIQGGVSADGMGNVYVSGSTSELRETAASGSDAFVTKYDSVGNLAWTRRLGTPSLEYGRSVAADALGNVYVAGTTTGSLAGEHAGNSDAFVSKLDSLGNVIWNRQLGTSASEYVRSLSADGQGNVVVAGSTYGSLEGDSAGGGDAFVSKFDSFGNLAWTRQLGSTHRDDPYAVSIDSRGDVYVGGGTWGALNGTNAGGTDAFIAKYDPLGNLAWKFQLGTSADEEIHGLASDGKGNLYVSGSTSGSLGGPNAGSRDGFVARLVVPEPASPALIGVAFAGALASRVWLGRRGPSLRV